MPSSLAVSGVGLWYDGAASFSMLLLSALWGNQQFARSRLLVSCIRILPWRAGQCSDRGSFVLTSNCVTRRRIY